MRSLTHGRMDLNGRGMLGVLGRRLLVTIMTAGPIVVVGGACSSDPVAVPVATGGGGSVIPPDDRENIERCGTDGVLCGDGCCTEGNLCSDFGKCIPDAQ